MKFNVGDKFGVITTELVWGWPQGAVIEISGINQKENGVTAYTFEPGEYLDEESIVRGIENNCLVRIQASSDNVKHPPHYTSHPSGVECIEITKHMGFCLGNVVKYVWRADLKNDAIEDLEKAREYLDTEIEKRKNEMA